MIKNLNTLADRLKGVTIDGQEISPEKLQEFLTSDKEVELKVNSVHLMNDDEFNTLKENSKKVGYSEGKSAGEEMTIKAIKNLKGLEFEGKTIDNLVNAYDSKLKVEFGKEPTEKVKEWEGKYNALKTTYETEKSALEKQTEQLNKQLKDHTINSNLQASIPELNGIKKHYASTLFRMEYDIEDRDGVLIAKKGGEIVKDKLGSPLPVNELFTSFASDNGWLKTPGRGAGNELGQSSKFKTTNEAMKYLKDNNIDPTSNEGLEIISKVGKD
jgi:hypothetical protein